MPSPTVIPMEKPRIRPDCRQNLLNNYCPFSCVRQIPFVTFFGNPGDGKTEEPPDKQTQTSKRDLLTSAEKISRITSDGVMESMLYRWRPAMPGRSCRSRQRTHRHRRHWSWRARSPDCIYHAVYDTSDSSCRTSTWLRCRRSRLTDRMHNVERPCCPPRLPCCVVSPSSLRHSLKPLRQQWVSEWVRFNVPLDTL